MGLHIVHDEDGWWVTDEKNVWFACVDEDHAISSLELMTNRD